MFEREIEYMKEFLHNNAGNDSRRKEETFRKRDLHMQNVFGWAKRIYNELDETLQKMIDVKSLYLACLFHDIGYGFEEYKNSHPLQSGDIWLKYANGKYDDNTINFVYFLISRHSNKELFKDNTTPLELIILMESDWLDEEGSMSICWDLMVEGQKNPQSYSNGLARIKKYSSHILTKNPMVTAPAKKYWTHKQEFVTNFIKELEFDLFI